MVVGVDKLGLSDTTENVEYATFGLAHGAGFALTSWRSMV